jgi:HK97 family phage major capsid protein
VDHQTQLRTLTERFRKDTDRMRELTTAAEAEDRSLNEGEREEFEELDKGTGELQERITRLKRTLGVGEYSEGINDEIGLTTEERKRFSFLKLVRAINPQASMQDKAAGAFELEASHAVAQKRGEEPRGAFVPMEVWARTGPGVQKRDLTAGAPTAGGNLVDDDLRPGEFIEALRPNMGVMQAGAITLDGLVGDVLLPKQTAVTNTFWLANEASTPTEGAPTYGQLRLTPHTVGAYVDISRQLTLQATPAIDALVRNDITRGLALATDLAALYGTNAGGQPQGLIGISGVNSPTDFAGANPTFPEVVALPGAVAADNADIGSMAFISESAMYYALMAVSRDAGSGSMVVQNGQIADTNTVVSNQVTSGDLWAGVWSQLVLGFWGGLDILVDPYSLSTSGVLRIVGFQSSDVQARNPESFAYNNDGA